ncbi:MAG: sugar kinase [Ruminococcaceae bacterium]|nr:sugar kinase [Oscillospiraceae bacterium]
MSKRIVCFGEIMLRLAPEGYYRFFQNDRMQATFGGGEANVAVSLANYGMDASYVTKLPSHAIGQSAINSLRALGVDTRDIVRGGERVGIYYLEKGASQRGSVCIYDRAYSAIQMAKREDFDWDKIFEGADWFHFTGITPAIGGDLVNICLDACKAAKAKGVKISCDLNYRGKLWTRAEAREAMTELCKYVDVCISNEEDAKDVFGIEAENTDIYGGKLDKEGYKSVAKQLMDTFGFEKVAITLRSSISASDNDWAGMLYDGENYCFSKEYHLHIVDRVGGGDSFGGGLIYALLSGKSTQDAIEFAVAASALKHSIEGDYNRVGVSEVEKLAGGDGSGRVQR